MELKDKVVVITGASRGLGKALAEIFTNEGSKVVVSARSKKDLESLSQELHIQSFVADVTDEKHVAALAEFAVQKFGRIDIWVNNAGIWLPETQIVEQDSKRVHEMFDVNVFGTIYGSKAALLQMKKQHLGTIVNIISTSALEGRAGLAGYVASKFAVAGFTQSLRLEAQPEGVTVFGIYPGGMRTHLFDEGKPENYSVFMDPLSIARKIIDNMKAESPEIELVLKRPKMRPEA